MGSEWFRRFGPAGGERGAGRGGVRLFCFPHAGGAASTFIPLSRELSGSVDVLAAQYPGRQDRRREEPVADIGRLADALADAVLGQAEEEPYAFFGHSMGAVLAYETARRIAGRRADGPVRLFLSGRGAPGAAPNPRDRMRTDADIITAVRGLGGTAPKALEDPELRAMVMPALRADYRAIGAYAWEPGEPLDIPFTVLIGDSDPVVGVGEADAWRDFTTAPTRRKVFVGGHFYLDGQIGDVARTVTEALGVRIPART
ncbi:thioesterase II family protein [Streptomyces sp. NPDC059989]|uniref:thioesterase II family protein n=1 Tax=Streptomyces sp. NPDC059989 TaxID=3347026 RepID=UPI00367F09F1